MAVFTALWQKTPVKAFVLI